MSQMNPNALHAFGTVGSTGAALFSAGAKTEKTGTGVYTLTLDQEADATECAVLVTLRGATSGAVRVEHTSDSVKTVKTFNQADGTTAADREFDFLVLKKPGS